MAHRDKHSVGKQVPCGCDGLTDCGSGDYECAGCGEHWPCKAERKWLKSNKGRIEILEVRVTEHEKTNDLLFRERRELQARVKSLEDVLTGVVLPITRDLLSQKVTGELTVQSSRLGEDYSPLVGRSEGFNRKRAGGAKRFEYVSTEGRTWVNGELIAEQRGL